MKKVPQLKLSEGEHMIKGSLKFGLHLGNEHSKNVDGQVRLYVRSKQTVLHNLWVREDRQVFTQMTKVLPGKWEDLNKW